MASYRCPSCGGTFNGKKCKNCNYESSEGCRYRPVPTVPDCQKPGGGSQSRQFRPVSPAPQWNPQRTTRKKQKTRLPRWVMVLLVVSVGLPILEGVLVGIIEGVHDLSRHTTAPVPSSYQETAPLPDTEDYQVLYEDDAFTLRIDLATLWQDGIAPVILENRTSHDVKFFAHEVILNDRLSSQYSTLYVEAESRDTGRGNFYLEPLSQGYPAKAALRLYACDGETYDTLLETAPLILTDPEGEIVPIPQPEGTPVMQGNGMALYLTDWENPEALASSILTFGMVNDTDRALSFYCESATANGKDVDLSLFCTLPPHTVGYADADCWQLEEALELTSADQLESLELTMGVFDEEAPTGQTLFPAFRVPLP